MVVSLRVDAMTLPALPLVELASVIRSKNAGPLCVTIDLFFRDASAYARASHSKALQAPSIACLYGLQASQIRRMNCLKFWPSSFPCRVLCVLAIPATGMYTGRSNMPLCYN